MKNTMTKKANTTASFTNVCEIGYVKSTRNYQTTNIYMKISMHTIGVGVMVAFIILLAFTQDTTSFGIYIAIALFVSGVVCTARMIASDHTEKEIYFGFFTGVVSQLISWYIF